MNQTSDSSSAKAQKGWLSRWTRKQWSRHWFVLKNGSLTYYRGPAAELCSFLDGVLDLSLIKHIEVQAQQQQQQQSKEDEQQQQHQGQHYHITGIGNNNNSHSLAPSNANSQFTFTLQMWNGERHQLGASSQAERQLWLKAINSCINDDSSSTSSTSTDSSDSSPTSNLSARSLDLDGLGFITTSRPAFRSSLSRQYAEQQQDNSAEQLTSISSLKSAINRRRELQLQQDDLLFNLSLAKENNNNKQAPEQQDIVVTRHQPQQEDTAQLLKQQQQQNLGKSSQLTNLSNSSGQTNQAFKRRLVCDDAREQSATASAGERNESKKEYHYLANQRRHLHHQPYHLHSESSEDDEHDDDDDDDEENDDDDKDDGEEDAIDDHVEKGEPLESQAQVAPPGEHQATGSSQSAIIRQKKRVTFDLSLSSQLSASDSSSASDSDSSLSSSSLSALSSSAPVSEDEADVEHMAPEVSANPKKVGLGETLESDKADDDDEDDGHRYSTNMSTPEHQPMEVSSQMGEQDDQSLVERSSEAAEVGASELKEARAKIDHLELKLSASFANYNQLELNYKQLQSELLKCDELHKNELNRLQAKVDELNRELLKSELSLVEAREKLQEQQENSYNNSNHSTSQTNNKSKALTNWLKATSQMNQNSQLGGGQSQVLASKPLLLSMHHVKHTIAMNQQTLSLKLLNHSKQIQRKLNELESKVDKIQCTNGNQ